MVAGNFDNESHHVPNYKTTAIQTQRLRIPTMKKPICRITQTVVTLLMISIASAQASDVLSFTEPYRNIAIPAKEIGVIDAILVREGDEVSQGQIVARLEDAVLKASLEVARAAKDSEGSLRAAEAALTEIEKRVESYRELRERGSATQRELDRAETQRIQSAAQLQSVREELEVRRLEYERTKAQLRQRQIVSPISGHIVVIEKEAGEFVAPTDPVVMRMVQLDMLKCVFSVPIANAIKMKAGQSVIIRVGANETKHEGFIEFVSPTADAQSGTVLVKIRLPNQQGKIRSGEACAWDLWTSNSKVQNIGAGPTNRKR